jgi:hypothetical protein
MMEYVGQAFNVMDQSVMWGHANGVAFGAHRIHTGNPKSDHTWWEERIAGKGTCEPQFSEIEGNILKIQQHLLLAFTFAMRQNLHFRQVLAGEGVPLLGSLDDDGNIVDPVGDVEKDRGVMEVGWIVEPVEFLCMCMGHLLNHCNGAITDGQYSNFKSLLRGAEGHFFEDLAEKVHGVMIIGFSNNLEPAEGSAGFDNYPQKPLVNAVKYLSAD